MPYEGVTHHVSCSAVLIIKWPAHPSLLNVCNIFRNEIKDKITHLLAYRSLAYLHINHWPTYI